VVVGIPGTGIGGLFYLVSALWLPVRAWRGRVARPRRVASALRQAALAATIVVATWWTGDLIARMGRMGRMGRMATRALRATDPAPAASLAAHPAANPIHLASVAIALVVLALVLLLAGLARTLARLRREPRVSP